MKEDKLLERLCELIDNMAFDYDRFSSAGQDTYDEICLVISQLMGG